MEVVPRRGDVILVQLDPTRGTEIRKTRPCVVVSPDELNRQLHTAIVAPMTTAGKTRPWRPATRFQKRDGFIALDQLRTVDRSRFVRKLGRLAPATVSLAIARLQELFSA